MEQAPDAMEMRHESRKFKFSINAEYAFARRRLERSARNYFPVTIKVGAIEFLGRVINSSKHRSKVNSVPISRYLSQYFS